MRVEPPRFAVVCGGLLATALAVALLVAPPLGTDLSAQVARADFARRYGALTPVDLRWYGGTVQYGYSWVSPVVMGFVGVRATGALALVTSTIALAVLLTRCGARRPVFATLLGAVAFAGNLVSGRVTFALGVALGLWGLAALTLTCRRWRLPLAAVGVLLASATSPPAGLFAGLAGGAMVLAGLPGRVGRQRGAVVDGLTVGIAAGAPIVLNAIVGGTSGVMNISTEDATHAIVTGLVTAVLVRAPVLRIGSLLSAVMVLAVYIVPSPIGLNATRLATMFVLPIVAGFAEPDRWLGWARRAARARVAPSAGDGPVARRAGRLAAWPVGLAVLVAVLGAVTYWQPPVLTIDLADAGNPTARQGYFAPLIAELRHRQPVGRVEVPPTRDYWEAAYVVRDVPLARGWLRQTDMARNELFFDGSGRRPLDAEEYRAWLVDNGVEYVALPDAKPSWVGRKEAELVAGRPAYLREVWRGEHWTLFEVAGRPSIATGATLVSSDGAAVTFDVQQPGEVLVRVAPSSWLRVREVRRSHPTASCDSPRLSPHGHWTAVRVSCAGRYSITS